MGELSPGFEVGIGALPHPGKVLGKVVANGLFKPCKVDLANPQSTRQSPKHPKTPSPGQGKGYDRGVV